MVALGGWGKKAGGRRLEKGWMEGLQRGAKKPGVMDMFIILIAVMLLQVYNYVKTYKITHFKYVWFLHFNYTIIKLFKIKGLLNPRRNKVRNLK